MAKRSTLILLTLLTASCVSPHKTYHAPSDAKVKAATHDLNVKVDTARATAAKSKKATEEVKALLDESVTIPPLIKTALGKLITDAPQYAGPLRDITAYTDDLIAKNAVLQEKVSQVVGWNTQLQDQLRAAENARVTLQKEQTTYQGDAGSLASEATQEREEKIVVQKKLLWYRVRFWGAWVALGAAVVGWILFGLLKVGVKWGTR